MNALTIAMGLLSLECVNGERTNVEENDVFVRDSSVENPLKRAKLSNNHIFDRPFVMPVFTVKPGRQYNFGINFYKDLLEQEQEQEEEEEEEEEEEQEEEDEEDEEEEQEQEEDEEEEEEFVNPFEDEVGYDEADPEEDDADANLIMQQFWQLNDEFNDLLNQLLLGEEDELDEPAPAAPSHKRRLDDEEEDDEQPDHKRCRIA